MNTMLDLKNMTDEEFSILVTPSAPQAAMYVKVEKTGSVLLSRKWGQRDISKERQKNSSQCRKNSQREQNSIYSYF